jgi:hypothetical protein
MSKPKSKVYQQWRKKIESNKRRGPGMGLRTRKPQQQPLTPRRYSDG